MVITRELHRDGRGWTLLRTGAPAVFTRNTATRREARLFDAAEWVASCTVSDVVYCGHGSTESFAIELLQERLPAAHVQPWRPPTPWVMA